MNGTPTVFLRILLAALVQIVAIVCVANLRDYRQESNMGDIGIQPVSLTIAASTVRNYITQIYDIFQLQGAADTRQHKQLMQLRNLAIQERYCGVDVPNGCM